MPNLSASEAVARARAFLEQAGVAFHMVTDVELEGDAWHLRAETFGRVFTLAVDATSGEVRSMGHSMLA